MGRFACVLAPDRYFGLMVEKPFLRIGCPEITLPKHTAAELSMVSPELLRIVEYRDGWTILLARKPLFPC